MYAYTHDTFLRTRLVRREPNDAALAHALVRWDLYDLAHWKDVLYTRPFAPRAPYAARYACSGRKTKMV